MLTKATIKIPWYVRWLLILVLSAVYNLIFMRELSPLYSTFHYNDGGCFYIIAKAWCEGCIPYQDYFDHKGPAFYLFYILAYLISGTSKWGALIIWSILLSLVILMLRDICKTLNTSRPVYYTTLFVFLAYCTAYGYSDSYCTEVISIPFQVMPIWVFVRCLRYGHGHHSFIDVLAYGLAFGVLMLIRPNNACVNCAIIISCIALYIKNRWYRDLLPCILAFITGLVIIVLPFVLYFMVHGALDDMLYCYIRFNMMYKGSGAMVNEHILSNSVRVVPVFLLCLYAFWATRKSFTGFWLGLSMLISAALITVVYISGQTFSHYFVILAPVVAVAFMLIISDKDTPGLMPALAIAAYVALLWGCVAVGLSWYKTMFILFVVGVAILAVFRHRFACIGAAFIMMTPLFEFILTYPVTVNSTLAADKSLVDVCNDISAVVPYADRDSIYCDEAFMYKHYFQYTNSRPVNKYFNLPKSVLLQTDPALESLIEADFVRLSPKWIFTDEDPTDILKGYICADYILADSLTAPDVIKPLYIYQRIQHHE